MLIKCDKRILCSSKPCLIPQPLQTYIWLGARVDHMERAVGQVKAPEAARPLREGEPKHSRMSHTQKITLKMPSRPHPPDRLTMIHARHNAGSGLINVHGYMVCT